MRRLFFGFHLLAFGFSFVAQNKQLPPGIEWRVSTWSPGGLAGKQTQAQSGEDWWYGHKNVKDSTGKTKQYVNVGYTSQVSTAQTFTNAQNIYNEGPDSPYNPITTTSYNYNILPEGCYDRDYLGEHRTPARGNIGMTALDGSMMYCKPKTIGALEEVIQDPNDVNSFYVVGVHLGVRPYKNKTNFIAYNQTPSNPADYFSCTAMAVSNYSNDIRHMYVAKIGIAGNVIWEGLYGFLDYANSPLGAYETSGYGYDIIMNKAGHLVALGFAQQTSGFTSPGYPFLAEIDPANGALLQKKILPVNNFGILPTTYSVTGSGLGGIGHSIEELPTPNNYAVAVTYYYSGSSLNDNNNAYVWGLDPFFNPLTNWPSNPVKFPGDGDPSYNSTVWEIMWHKGKNQLLVPVIRDCINCASAGDSYGYGYIYRMNADGTLAGDGVNPSATGYVNAFDLRLGVTETSDGGFAAVSSVRPPEADHSPATPEELDFLAPCPDLNFTDWDTDALIVKYDQQGEKVWSKTFDTQDGRKREAFPGDLKRQECLYKITQSDDGGYVISGNSSANFDDNYMAKLYPECNAAQTYSYGPNYVLDITSDASWNNSMNILGKVVIHPGVILTVNGPNTRISFADSRQTGIETNVSIMDGGSLRLTNGAILTSIDPGICPGSHWDGVHILNPIASGHAFVMYPNPASENFFLHYTGDDDAEISYHVNDMLGREVDSGILNKEISSEVSTENWSGGIYLVSLKKGKDLVAQQKLSVLR